MGIEDFDFDADDDDLHDNGTVDHALETLQGAALALIPADDPQRAYKAIRLLLGAVECLAPDTAREVSTLRAAAIQMRSAADLAESHAAIGEGSRRSSRSSPS